MKARKQTAQSRKTKARKMRQAAQRERNRWHANVGRPLTMAAFEQALFTIYSSPGKYVR